jgi:hypothetical protein
MKTMTTMIRNNKNSTEQPTINGRRKAREKTEFGMFLYLWGVKTAMSAREKRGFS